MNGKRAKQLRKQLAQQLGCSPKELGKLVVSDDYKTGMVGYIPSRWRRAKKIIKKGQRDGIRAMY